MFDTWLCAWREIVRRRRRTLGNVCGYLLAVFALVVLVSLLRYARDSASAILRHTGTHFVAFVSSCPEPCYLHDVSEKGEAFIGNGGVLTSPLSTEYLEQIRRIPSVKHAAPYILFRFKDSASGLYFSVGGFDPQDVAAVGTTCCAETDLISGQFLGPSDSGWVLVEEAYARNRELKMGQEIAIAGAPFRVAGIVNPGVRPGKADIYMLFQDAAAAIQRRLPTLNGFNLVLVEVRSATEQEQAIRAVRDTLPKGIVSSYACYKPAALVLGMNAKAAWLISAVVGLLALAFLMKSQLAAVIERRHEIGILKAIGWSSGHILAQIVGESVLQAAAGGLAGCLAAAAVLRFCPLARWAGVEATATLAVSPALMAAGLAGAILGGALAGLLPAFRAARQSPATALRQL